MFGAAVAEGKGTKADIFPQRGIFEKLELLTNL